MRILVMEDDDVAAGYICLGLAEEGHDLHRVSDGHGGLFRGGAEDWDLLIVDRMMPGLDGLAVVRALRAAKVQTPVLFLTTLGGIDDRVEGLNAGGDDYLVKPFALAELAARVRALGRRPARGQAVTQLRYADLDLDLLTRTARRGGRVLDLQPREFQILEFLVRHAEHVVTRAMLLERIWGFNFDPTTNVVESHISRLRGKVDRGQSELIHTVRGAGYCVRAAS